MQKTLSSSQLKSMFENKEEGDGLQESEDNKKQ